MATPHHFNADQPLKRSEEDRLDRRKFAAELANGLASWTGGESLVVSLNGEWGSGKTTLKNFVAEELAKKKPAPIVGEFNPWQWSGQDKLLEGFLQQLAVLLGKPEIGGKNDQIVKRFKLYAAALRLGGSAVKTAKPILGPLWAIVGVIFFGLLHLWGGSDIWIGTIVFIAAAFYATVATIPGLFDSTVKYFEAKGDVEKRTLEELRQDVADEMAKLDRVVIVFIDDMDRLTNREIRLLIQLVKANVHFPNLIYCLLFQKDMVAASLAMAISGDGDKFLRKIIQVPFDVPLPSKGQLQKILTEGLEQILTRDGIKAVQDIERWNQIFPDTLWRYFENVRDVKRFLGSFEFYFRMHLNENVLEVNPIDLIAIETLRMFDHTAFLDVGTSFFRKGLQTFNYFDDNKVAKDFSEEVTSIVEHGQRTPERKRLLTEVLHFLFPQAKNVGRGEAEHDWLATLRICHPTHFDKYFRLSLEAGHPSAKDMAYLIEVSGDRDKVVKLFERMYSGSFAVDFLELVMASREQIPTSSLTSFITALLDVGDALPKGVALFGTDLQFRCVQIIFQRLKIEPEPLRTTVLWDACYASTGVGLMVRLVASEERKADGKIGEQYLLPENEFPRFRDLAVERIRAYAESGTLLDNAYASAMIFRWRDWAGKDEVAAWVKRTIQSPINARKLLTKLTATSYIGTRAEPLLHAKVMEDFVLIEDLLLAANQQAGVSYGKDVDASLTLDRASLFGPEGV